MIVDVRTRLEKAEAALREERDTRGKLERALQECSEGRKVERAELTKRVQAVEKQHADALVEHRNAMEQSQARVLSLQRELEVLTAGEASAQKRLELQRDVTAAQIARVKSNDSNLTLGQLRELKYKQAIADLKAEIEKAKREAKPMPTESPAVQQFDKARVAYDEARNAQEAKLMEARSQTYEEMLEALTKAQAEQSETGLEKRLMQIRKDGARRENEKVKDLIELNTIHEKLAMQNKLVRQQQWKLLEDANEKTKAEMAQLVRDGGDREKMRAALAAYRDLQPARQSYVRQEQKNHLVGVQENERYLRQLESDILPKMRLTEAQIETYQLPEMKALRDRIAKEREATLMGIPAEQGHLRDKQLSASLMQNRLKAMLAESNRLSRTVDAFIENPTPDAGDRMGEAMQVTADDIMKRNKAAAELNDSKPARTTFVVQGPAEATKHGAVVPSKNQIRTSYEGQVRLHHADSMTHITDMPATFAPTKVRLEKNARKDRDTIVVSYSREMPGVNAQPIKYQMMLNGLREVFPTIQQMSPNGAVSLQMVEVDKDGNRYDRMAEANLPKGCTFATCQARAMSVTNATSAESILNDLHPNALSEDRPTENHFVLSVSVPGKPVVHIVDVLKTSMSSLDTKLLDESWLTYLEPVIANGATIDLIQSSWTPKNEQEAKVVTEDLEFNRRLASFLAKFHEMSKSTD
jgi:hypothetical protein